MIKRMLSAFAGIVFIVSMGTCIAQDLSKLSYDDRQSIELACSMAKVQGPASYHNCLESQLRALGDGTAPDLSKLSWDDRQSIELACSLAKVEGPATYHNCLNAHRPRVRPYGPRNPLQGLRTERRRRAQKMAPATETSVLQHACPKQSSFMATIDQLEPMFAATTAASEPA